MTVYADYDYYVNSFYGGKISDQDQFEDCARDASLYIDRVTFRRIGKVRAASEVENLEDCTCAMAEEIWATKYSGDDHTGLTSENTDGYSASYTAEADAGTLHRTIREAKLKDIASMYLQGSGLLYRGVVTAW